LVSLRILEQYGLTFQNPGVLKYKLPGVRKTKINVEKEWDLRLLLDQKKRY
jgi:hypothetical protein